jgi:hypothetical protein
MQIRFQIVHPEFDTYVDMYNTDITTLKNQVAKILLFYHLAVTRRTPVRSLQSNYSIMVSTHLHYK